MSDVPPQKPIVEPAAPAVSEDDKLWALLAHLSYFVLAIFGPLIIWIVRKDESPFVEDQAKEALNFQLSVVIVAFVTACTVVGPLIVAVGGIVYTVIGAMEAYKGVAYRYPYTIRMIN